MNLELLCKHITHCLGDQRADPAKYAADLNERKERVTFFQSWTSDRLRTMKPEELAEYLSKLWAMRIWGNKQYVVDQLITNNGLDNLLKQLSDLVWAQRPLDQRWDAFRKSVKGMGPAMMSEILCHVHPTTCMLWNRRAYIGLTYLAVQNLPRYDYQVDGRRYEVLCKIAEFIADEMRKLGANEPDLLTVDYFIWSELQIESFPEIPTEKRESAPPAHVDKVDEKTANFIHDDVRDKIADIGRWLGFRAETETKVADGAVIDALWEATIGNLGRVIYVFEVQTKGSIDSLILNLLKALNNPAVQGIVAVSDAAQLAKIRAEAATVPSIKEKLKCWNYAEVLQVHEALEGVNEAINSLGLVPQGF